MTRDRAALLPQLSQACARMLVVPSRGALLLHGLAQLPSHAVTPHSTTSPPIKATSGSRRIRPPPALRMGWCLGWGKLKVVGRGAEAKGERGRPGTGAGSVRVDDEAREGAVLVGVTAVHLPAVQLDEDFVTHIQVQDHAVAGVVVVLVGILGDGAGPDLVGRTGQPTHAFYGAGVRRGRSGRWNWTCESNTTVTDCRGRERQGAPQAPPFIHSLPGSGQVSRLLWSSI